MRHEGAGADLDAADARYYITCCQTFTGERNTKTGTKRSVTSNRLASKVEVEVVVSSLSKHRQNVEFCGITCFI